MSPMKSEAQRRWMHANKPEMAKRWEKYTPKGKLPARKKAAHDLGLVIGICQSDRPLEAKLAVLHKSAADSRMVTSALAAHAGEWLLRREQEHPGFVKDACAYMEKRATNGEAAPKVAAPAAGSPEAMWQLGKSQFGKKPGISGTLSSVYGFLQKNPWVLPMGLMALGGFGGGAGMLMGGLGGFMAQRYLPQLAGWGMKRFAPKRWGAFSPQQQQQILGSADPYGTARGLVTTGMGQYGMQQAGEAAGRGVQQVGQLAGRAGQAIRSAVGSPGQTLQRGFNWLRGGAPGASSAIASR